MFVATIFAAATGIVGASVTILGIMAGKSMIRSGYDVKLSSGLIAAGGTLGILIPPSIMLVVMGPVLEVPVTTLFAAAIVPGLLLALMFTGYAMIRCLINPALGPALAQGTQPTSMREVWVSSCWAWCRLPHWCCRRSAASCSDSRHRLKARRAARSARSLLTAAYRRLTWRNLKDALVKTLEITVLILFLVAASNFFGAVFARLGTPTMITEVLLGFDLHPYVMLFIIMAVIFLMGWPLEWVPIVLIVVPFLLPLVRQAGIRHGLVRHPGRG